MNPRSATFWVFSLGACLVLGVLAWVTSTTLRLEHAEATARVEAVRQESMRLALWRMDSTLAPLIARESARPYFHYQPFFPAQAAYTSMLNAVKPGDVLVPSPLLENDSPFVNLNFQRAEEHAGKQVTYKTSSPQVPDGNLRDLAESRYGFNAPVAQSAERLEKLERLFDQVPPEKLAAINGSPAAQDQRPSFLRSLATQTLTGSAADSDKSQTDIAGQNGQLFYNSTPQSAGPAQGYAVNDAATDYQARQVVNRNAVALQSQSRFQQQAEQAQQEAAPRPPSFGEAGNRRDATELANALKKEAAEKSATPDPKPGATPEASPVVAGLDADRGKAKSDPGAPAATPPSPTPAATAPPAAATPPAPTPVTSAGAPRPSGAAEPMPISDKSTQPTDRLTTSTPPAAGAPPLSAQPSSPPGAPGGTGGSVTGGGGGGAGAANVERGEPKSPAPDKITDQTKVTPDLQIGGTTILDAAVKSPDNSPLSLGAPAQPSPGNSSARDSTRVEQGEFQPVWLGPAAGPRELIFVRWVTIDTRRVLQGFWVDWPALRASLLDSIKDLLPAASLSPVDDHAIPPNPGRTLAAIPAELVAPAVSPGSIHLPAWTPTRTALVITWLTVLSAIAVAGWMLHSASELAERRGRFVSAVTHELRTPLTTFCLYSQMLADGMVDSEDSRKEYLGTLKSESTRLAGIVENVLLYARLSRPRQAAHNGAHTTVAQITQRVLPSLTRRAAESGLSLEVTSETDPATPVHADAGTVERILFNLVDNAAKYASAAGDHRLDLRISRPGTTVAFTLADRGPGIAPADAQRIFEPFFRAPHHEGTTTPGLGLGLALARGLARQSGGDLRLDPAPSGASFTLTLPTG